jgi:hypothetical protein
MNTTIELNAIENPTHFIKLASSRNVTSGGNREYGSFQIHSSTNIFPTFGRDYFGTPEMKVNLEKRNNEKLTSICGMYGIGGQSLTCEDGIQQDDGSWIFNGKYDCWCD